MKTLFYIALLIFPVFSSAQDIVLSKKDILDIVVSTSQETLCIATTTECLGISISTCKSEINEMANAKCSSHIPAEGIGMDKVNEVSLNAATCLSKEIVNKHSSAIAKNKDSAACKTFMK